MYFSVPRKSSQTTRRPRHLVLLDMVDHRRKQCVLSEVRFKVLDGLRVEAQMIVWIVAEMAEPQRVQCLTVVVEHDMWNMGHLLI